MITRHWLAATCIALTLISAASAAKEAPVVPTSLDIASQPLADALSAFGHQSGLQVMFLGSVGAGITSPRLQGTYRPSEALALLLANTSLMYEFINDRTVAIKEKSLAAPSSMNSSENNASLMRVADGMQEGPRSADARVAEATVETPVENEEKARGMPEMVVQGARTRNADIRRTENDIQPYVVFGREEISRSGATSVEDFLKNRLPMNTVSDSANQFGSSLRGNQSEVNLRGLGADQTLILINGRRMPGTFTLSTNPPNFQPDINGISMAAIERIEVLPTTASGIYGGSATGGVINIILRQDYNGLEMQGMYENTFDSDASNLRVDANAGFSFREGKTSLLLSGSHSASTPLLVAERDFALRGRELLNQNDPSAFASATSPPTGYTTNICTAASTSLTASCGSAPLVLDNGTSLGFNRTFVPVGYAGRSVDPNGLQLVTNAGKYNLENPNDVTGARNSLLNNPTVKSAGANLRHEFNSHFEVFADASLMQNEGRSYSAGLGGNNSFIIPAAAANNPFNSNIRVSVPLPGYSFAIDSSSESMQAASGLIVRLPHQWSTGLEHSWSRSRVTSKSTDPAFNQTLTAALQAASLNTILDLNAFPLDLSSYLLPSPNSIYGPAETVLNDSALRTAGPIFTLPAGRVMLTSLIEHRREKAQTSFAINQLTSVGNPQQISYSAPQHQSVDSVYLEASVPIFSKSQHIKGVQLFDLQLSVRRDEYETISHRGAVTVPSVDGPLPDTIYSTNETASTDYLAGLRFSPLQGLIFRGSVGTGFLPPSLRQITAVTTLNTFSIFADPKRNNVSGLVALNEFVIGGNPDLRPEESKSYSLGMIVNPTFLPALRVSIDYTRVKKDDEITTLTAQQILDNEDLLPGRVVRGARLAGDPVNWAGPVIRLDTTAANVSKADLEAYDFQLDYSLALSRLGTFNFFTLVTWQPMLEQRVTDRSATTNSAGFSSGPLKWRGNLGLNWNLRNWSAGWAASYFDSYRVYSPLSTNPAQLIQRQGQETIPSQMYHDVFVKYRLQGERNFAYGIFANTEMMLGIQNVLDKDPPIIAGTTTTGGYSKYGDPRLRRYSVMLKKAF